ncbi:MAG: DUF481 domain-containing protein [Gammaproteobacteria bacterium]|nr:MAG: DUF481 domain-containing protein [Gammaproteobacteria bacterium]
MRHPSNIASAIATFMSLACLPAIAGTLTLTNGDVIHGELQGVDKSQVIWKSDNLGVIHIAKAKVAGFTSTAVIPEVKTPEGTAQNCSLNMTDRVTRDCANGLQDTQPLATLMAIEPPPAFSGDARFSFNRKDGNTDSADLDFIVNSQWLQEQYRHELELLVESEESDGDVVDEHYEANYQLNYDFNERWFNYTRLGYEKDRFNAIDEQYELGAGIGHRFNLDNQMRFNLQLGAAYLVSHHPDDGTDNDLAGRWGFKLDWPVPDSKLTLFHHHELLWTMDDINNNQVDSSTGIKLPLMGNLFSELRYDYDYVSEPSDGQKHADEEWVIAVGYEW